MEDRPETPTERLQRRTVRRWKRRARIVGPFFGVPLLLATLLLSVDFIEYQPQEERSRLVDRPITLPAQESNTRSQRARLEPTTNPTRLHPSQVSLPDAVSPDDFLASKDNAIAFEVAPAAVPLPKPPPPPYGTSGY
jgi:hypothetical protein